MAKTMLDSFRADPIKGLLGLAAVIVAGAVAVGAMSLAMAKLGPLFHEDQGKGFALAAALIAVATTPIAFAVLGRMDWFQARRGRTYMRPEFWSVCAGMALIMGIPAIFAAMVLKSGEFDKNRYEFDPNKSWSVLEQGRGYADLQQADAGVRREMAYLAEERKNLVNTVKKLDESMLVLRAASGGTPAAQAIPDVLQNLAGVRRSVGLDGPQQLMDFTAPPAEIRGTALLANAIPNATPGAPAASAVNVPTASSPIGNVPATAAPAGGGLSPAIAAAEVDTVPAPQKAIAAMLPLADLPPGWTAGKSGAKHLETFNAENLFEKIDGRAESFVQYAVKGMAYAYFHPTGDESNEVQLYIFEMENALKAMGKYGSEKPESVKLVEVGTEGYAAAGSTLFHAGPYYTQIVSTRDDAKFAAFALEIARKVAAKQKVGPLAASGKVVSTPESLFALLPPGPGRSDPKYDARDVFGFSFLSDVFMADYKEGGKAWEGFIRPYPSPEQAKSVFDQYVQTVQKDGAKVKVEPAEGADQFVVSDNVGLFDVVFRKGNIFGGTVGGPDAASASTFARSFLKGLPGSLPPIESEAGGKPADAPKGEPTSDQ